MISYEIDVGFAIGRLVRVFHEVCMQLVGDPERVHFSFASVGNKKCSNLPPGFGNILEFNYRQRDDAAVERMARYVRSHDIRTVIALDLSVSAGFLGAARRAGVRRVVAYWGAPMSSENSGLKLALKKLEVALLRRSKPDLFIFESEAMRRLAVRGRGVDPCRTTVVNTGVDAEKFRPMPEQASLVYQRFSIPAQRRIVVYMGHLHERKGVHVLMRAIDHIVKRLGRTDVHGLFLGNRNGEEQGFSPIWRDVESYITFGGYQSDIPQLLAGCYVGCIPSTGWDSYPMSSLEMQACGLPVVVSDWQGVPETLENGSSGIVTPVGDPVALGNALVALIDEPSRRADMSAAARRRIESGYTVAHQVQNLVARIGGIGRLT